MMEAAKNVMPVIQHASPASILFPVLLVVSSETGCLTALLIFTELAVLSVFAFIDTTA
jgi:ABC-type anion transport system duplicated permease subunit